MFEMVSDLLGLGGFRRLDNQAARVGVIDIGSNSIRIVVFDGASRAPAVFFNEKALCGLGATLERDGRLSAVGRRNALKTLRRFDALARRMRLDVLDVVGTAALRDALDGPDFVDEVRRRVGLTSRVADGVEEARLSAQGVLLGEPRADGIVADIGGASMELVALERGWIGEGVTSPLGPLRLQGLAESQSEADLDAAIDARLEAALATGALSRRPPKRDGAADAGADAGRGAAVKPGRDLFIVGGSWRAVVKAYMADRKYPLKVLHGFALDGPHAAKMARWAARLDAAKMRALADVSQRRADVAPLAARVLERLILRLAPGRVVLSAFGLREGVLWEHLPPALRAEDPLVGACSQIERAQARAPGFGDELSRWLSPLISNLPPARARLAHAACLLVDANWSAHPDYRPAASFELVTRNNFGGVDHHDRLFLGAALLHRYKGGRRVLAAEPAMKLLDEPSLKAAELLGRGMRLGAALSGAATGILPRNALVVEDRRLTLRLCEEDRALDGEPVRKRLDSLGAALGAKSTGIASATG